MKSTLEGAGGDIGTVSVLRSKHQPAGDVNSWTGGYMWTIEFLDEGGDVPMLSIVDDSTLTETNGASAQAAPAELVKGNEVGGQFKLAFADADGNVEETAFIDHDASDGEVESALEALSIIDDVTVTRSTAGPALGYDYTITFSELLLEATLMRYTSQTRASRPKT